MSLLPIPTEEPFCVALVGKKRSGKTRLLIDLLKHFYADMFDLIVFVSPTIMLQENVFEDGTGIVIFTQWKPDILKALCKYMYERNSGDRDGRDKEQCLLILDDVGLDARKGRLGEDLDRVAFTCRHFGISLIEVVQRVTLLSPSVRSQIDALICFCEQNPLERQNLLKSFGFGDKKVFFDTFDKHTEEKYSFIMIRNIGGKYLFADLDGEIVPVRTSARYSGGTGRTQPGTSSAGGSRLPGVSDRQGFENDLRRLFSANKKH